MIPLTSLIFKETLYCRPFVKVNKRLGSFAYIFGKNVVKESHRVLLKSSKLIQENKTLASVTLIIGLAFWIFNKKKTKITAPNEDINSALLLNCPNEILIEVLKYVDPIDTLTNVAKCCRRLQSLSKDDRLWKFYKTSHLNPESSKLIKDYLKYLIHSEKIRRGFYPNNIWRHVNPRFRSFNLTAANPHPSHFIEPLNKDGQHRRAFEREAGVFSNIIIWDDYPYSGFEDGTIKKWDLNTDQCVATFKGHTNRVRTLTIWDGHLYSGSWDGTIKKWDLNTDQCVATFVGHTDHVPTLTIWNDHLYTGSRDGTIKKWDLNTDQCVATFKSNTGWCPVLTVWNDHLYSKFLGGTIKKWDLNTDQCVATFRGHTDCVVTLTIWNDHLYSGSADHTIKKWNLNTDQCVATFIGHTDYVVTLTIWDGHLYSGSSDGTIRIWDTLNCA